MGDDNEKTWYRLDNAAKIFPPASGRTDTKVFRFACELTEPVNGDILQSALGLAVMDFPGFKYVLKRGLFWYYLEQSEMTPAVREEDTPPCSKIYSDSKSLLFDVTYYKRRINLEVYHALTDGTGALHFLKALTLHYLKLAHPETMSDLSDIGPDASQTQKMTDSFEKYYDRSKKVKKTKIPAAYQIRGQKETEWRINIIEGVVSTSAVLSKAHEYGATATAFLTAVLIYAIYGEMSVNDKKKPVVISVPVNLRNYFQSGSTRNFFAVADIGCDFSECGGEIGEITKKIKERFAERLSERHLQNQLNLYLSYERNLLARIAPLPIKNLYMGAAYRRGAKAFSAAFSNLGRIEMPDEAKAYIRLFDVFFSTEKLQLCLCSYGDNMNISFTSPFVSADIQRGFFKQLAKMGIAVEITANDLKGGR